MTFTDDCAPLKREQLKWLKAREALSGVPEAYAEFTAALTLRFDLCLGVSSKNLENEVAV